MLKILHVYECLDCDFLYCPECGNPIATNLDHYNDLGEVIVIGKMKRETK